MKEKKSIRARAPKASSPTVRYVMQRNTGRETYPEEVLRSALHKIGLRFRKDVQPEIHLKIKADIVFPKKKICVFIDGCFWHGCPLHFKVPKTNSEWWKEKITDNKNRDYRQSKDLIDCGWTVIRYWEHDVTPNNIDALCLEIERSVKSRKVLDRLRPIESASVSYSLLSE